MLKRIETMELNTAMSPFERRILRRQTAGGVGNAETSDPCSWEGYYSV